MLLALLVGCTTLNDIAPGTPLAEVQARFGRPVYACPLPEAGRRVIWSQQPSGQHAWAATVDANARVQAIEAILTDASFRRLRLGMDSDALRCTFGPPAIITQAGLGEQRRVVWSYRYRQAQTWNALMHVYLDHDARVTRFHPGPDPLFEDGPWFEGMR